MSGLRLVMLGCLLGLGLGIAAASTASAQAGPNADKPAAKPADVKSSDGKSDPDKKDAAPAPKAGDPGKGGAAASDDPKARASDRAADGVKRLVRLSYNPGTSALVVVVAQERGFFHREGLVVSAIPVTSQRAVVAALASGASDFATGSQAWLIDMAQADLPIKVVALNGYEQKLEFVVPAWEKGVKKVSDLKGKTILVLQGTHNFASVPELFKILLFNRVRLTDVKIAFFPLAQLGTVFTDNQRIQNVMRQRKIAAFLGYKEYTDFYVKQKRATVLLANEDIRKLLGRNGPRPVFANTQVIERHPETVQRFVNAWVAAQDYIVNNKEDATRILRLYLLRQYGITLTEETAREYVDLVRYDRFDWTPQDIQETNINAKMIAGGRDILFSGIKDPKKRPFQTAPSVDRFIDNGFVEKAVAKLKRETDELAKRGIGGKAKDAAKDRKSDTSPDVADRSTKDAKVGDDKKAAKGTPKPR